MNEEIKKDLEENAKEYYKNALEAEVRGEYNTSVTLFFKTISSLCDLFIVVKKGIMPSNHSERFRILETNFYEIYVLMDKAFPVYQESYKIKLEKSSSEKLKNDAKKLFELLDIKV
ncbi:MAG: hypothetical protein KKF56_03750 [Nanoarchaeota archaeon]|nr:hypothetical protein [Nanoarchaeota archaeon]